MITKIILETILICNRTNKKFPGRKSCSGLVTGNFENSKLFEGLVILIKKNRKNLTSTHTTHFILIFSCLFFRLVYSSSSSFILSFVLPLVSRLSSPLLSLCPLCLSVCLRVLWGVCVREGLCVVWGLCVVLLVCVWCVGVCVCLWCVVVFGVWCGTQKKPPCVDSKRPRVYRHHAHMCYHMRAWCRYTQGRFESTHGGFLDGHTGRDGGETEGEGGGVTVSSAHLNLPT